MTTIFFAAIYIMALCFIVAIIYPMLYLSGKISKQEEKDAQNPDK